MLLAVGSSGSGFSFNDYDNDYDNSNVSSHIVKTHCSIDPAHMAKDYFQFSKAVVLIREADFLKQG